MPTPHWKSVFDDVKTVGNELLSAYETTPVTLDDDESRIRWSPTRQPFNYVPEAGDFVYGAVVGAVLHSGIMFAAMMVLGDSEWPLTVQEEHRFFHPVQFDDTYHVVCRPDRRTRTPTSILREGNGNEFARSSAVSQIVSQA